MITAFFAPKDKKAAVTTNSGPTHGTSIKRSRDNDASSDVVISVKKQLLSSHVVVPSSAAVAALLAHLDPHHSPGIEGENEGSSWKKELENYVNTPKFQRLAQFVATERQNHTVYPPERETFAALNATPLDQVRVVIVGQDPYHGPGQAHGLCFSVLPGQPIPPSLKNIYLEVKGDAQLSSPFIMPRHGHLMAWARQGVLLLNTVLTVRRGEANSHQRKGWEDFTDEIIRIVDRCSRRQGRGVVFLLWGKPATTKAQALLGANNKHSSPHTILCSSHPSPLGARKTQQPFLGSRCFSQCNEALKRMGYAEIDWNVQDPSA